MAKSPSTPTPRSLVRSLVFSRDNGSPTLETDTERLARLEDMLTRTQAALDTQFQRLADMQVLIDRLTAERNRQQKIPSSAGESRVSQAILMSVAARADPLVGNHRRYGVRIPSENVAA